MRFNQSLFFVFFALCYCCVVLCEHHRIIIQERVPGRSKGHHPRTKDVSHGHQGRSKGNGHQGHKKKKQPVVEESSYEDEGYGSLEKFTHHRHKGHNHNSKHTTRKRPSTPDFGENPQESQRTESKHYFHGEWVPLAPESIHVFDDRQKGGYREQKKTKNQPQPIFLEYTTQYPLVHFEPASTMYHHQEAYPDLGFVSSGMQVGQSPVLAIQQPKIELAVQNMDRLKNHKPGYDVTEAESNTRPFFLALPEQTSQRESVEHDDRESDEKHDVTTRRPHRNRGRGRNSHRGKKKY